jgi:hypothetical protein
VGSGRGESIGVYIGSNANAQKISTSEIDQILSELTMAELAQIFVEPVFDQSHQFLRIHLPTQCLVFDAAASGALKSLVWHVLQSGQNYQQPSQYRARNAVNCYNRWMVFDTQSAAFGYTTKDISSHWGNKVAWAFATPMLYTGGTGAAILSLELVGLNGRQALGVDARVSTQYTLDGMAWSQPKTISLGGTGARQKRAVWFQCGVLRNFRAQRFFGDSAAHFSVARLEANIEKMSF